jgi:hypothetical protein
LPWRIPEKQFRRQIVFLGRNMSDENETVASTTSQLLTLRSPLATTTLWLQRVLLTTLVLAHLAAPFVFAIGDGGELVRDAALSSQLSLLLISLTLLGMRWPGIVMLLIGGAFHFFVWFAIYAATQREWVFDTLIVPAVVLAISLAGLRWWGWHGAWNPKPATTTPWQVSIRQLLFVSTAVAIAFAGANWLRRFPGFEFDHYWLIVGIDGLGNAAIGLTALWAMGTPGSGGLKFGVLLLIVTALAGCQIFAFRMEDFWYSSAISSLAYAVVLAGSLAIWRLCGWRIIFREQLN